MKRIKYETGYKVVKKRSLISCIIAGKNIARQYKLNEWVKPIKDNGPLCVFNTIEDAKDFKCNNNTIYECLYEKSSEHKVYFHSGQRREERNIFYLPKGTVLATKVKLLKRIR